MPVTVVTSFADVVDEQYDPELDGFDGIDPRDRVSLPERAMAGVNVARALFSSTSGQAAGVIVVPYPTGVGEGDVSDQVFAVKRAYARSRGGLRLRRLMATRTGETLVEANRRRRTWGPQFSAEFGAKTYTQARHQKLAPYFDAFALALLRRAPVPSPRDVQISRQLGWHNALYNRRFQVPYSQARPSQLYRAELITRADCSGSVAGGCHWAGILPRVDWRYTNTWIQVVFGEEVSGIRAARPGDVIFYGSPSHEALYLGDGLVWSFGSYPAKILPHSYRHDRRAIRRFVPL